MQQMIGVEIFAVGTWVGNRGPMKWTQDDLIEIVQNTNALMANGHLKPKLKFGHSEEQFWEEAQVLEGQEDGDPSIGWANKFRIIGDKIICDFSDMPDIVYNVIQAKLYSQISAEIVFIQEFGWFISAVALLGADAPAVKTLDDLQQFLSDSTVNIQAIISKQEPQSKAVLTFSNPCIGVVMPKEETTPTPTSGDKAVEVIVGENIELKVKNSELVSNASKLTSENEDLKKELNGYKKEKAKEKFSEQKAAILAPYKADSEKGLLPPAFVSEVESYLNSQQANFTIDNTLFLSPELVRKAVEAYSEHLPTGEQGGNKVEVKTGMAADDEFVKAVKEAQLNSGGKMSYKEASNLVAQTKPELFKKYTDWTEEVSALGRVKGV